MKGREEEKKEVKTQAKVQNTPAFKTGLYDRFGEFISTELEILKRMANQETTFYIDPNKGGFSKSKYIAKQP